jgi:hypothetical protein
MKISLIEVRINGTMKISLMEVRINGTIKISLKAYYRQKQTNLYNLYSEYATERT